MSHSKQLTILKKAEFFFLLEAVVIPDSSVDLEFWPLDFLFHCVAEGEANLEKVCESEHSNGAKKMRMKIQRIWPSPVYIRLSELPQQCNNLKTVLQRIPKSSLRQQGLRTPKNGR